MSAIGPKRTCLCHTDLIRPGDVVSFEVGPDRLPNPRHQCRAGRCLNGAAHVARCRPGAGDVASYGLCAANIARCRLGAADCLARWCCCCSWWWWPCFSDERKHKAFSNKTKFVTTFGCNLWGGHTDF